MDGKRALVTGGAKRLGRAMALDLAASGWDVAIHYGSSAKEGEAAAAEARETGVSAVALGADLLDETAVGTLVGRAADALGGPLTLLINNASIFEDDRVGAQSRESWDRALESNLRAPVRLTGDFANQVPDPEIDAQGEPVARACVVNMIDQRVWKPTPFFASYTVAKAGLEMFTKTSAQALAPRVRVNGIGPGPTLRADRQSEAHFARQRAACPLKRGADLSDILSAMRFILACNALTGQMLAIDGGQHLAWETPDILGVDL